MTGANTCASILSCAVVFPRFIVTVLFNSANPLDVGSFFARFYDPANQKLVFYLSDHIFIKAGTHKGACSCSTLSQHAPGAKLSCLHQRFLAKKYVAPEVCSLISNWFDMREQVPGANLKLRLHDSVSGVSSLVCTEICLP